MYKWNENKYSVWLFVFSLSFFYQGKKKNPASNFLDAQEMTCGRGWGGYCDWTTHPLSSDCVTRFLRLLAACTEFGK